MTTDPTAVSYAAGAERTSANAVLVRAFPMVGEMLAAVQSEWDAVDQLNGAAPDLPRPWEPATCTSPLLRRELWIWLDTVVDWINRECTWDPSDLIPACWPRHPHLVHDLAVLADLRRRASLTANSTALDEWQRILLPSFLDRVRTKTRHHCDDIHHDCPSDASRRRASAPASSDERRRHFDADIDGLPS